MDARDEERYTFFELMDAAMSNRLPPARDKRRNDVRFAREEEAASAILVQGIALDLDAQLDQDKLLQLFQTDLSFDGELPVSACVMYSALVHWRSFEVESTDVFDKIIGIMRAAIGAQDPYAAPDADAVAKSVTQPEAASSGAGKDEDAVGSIVKMAYWLANAASLLLLLLRSFKTNEVPREMAAFHKVKLSKDRDIIVAHSIFTFLQAIFSPNVPSEDEIAAAEADGVQLVKPTFPALLFGKELAAYVKKVYMYFANNLRNDIAPILVAGYEAWVCILL
ncbi:unnamed protein product [Closterium sp. Yama58-4]|nr:unnamed protein product [Closterium sp. Yama58-4]